LIALNNACRNLPPDSKVIEPEMLKVLAEIEGECLEVDKAKPSVIAK
jgi:hypothetical protein